MSLNALSITELALLLFLLIAFDASIPISRWLSAQLSMTVHVADIWAYLLLLVASLFVLILAAADRVRRKRPHGTQGEAREEMGQRSREDQLANCRDLQGTSGGP